MRVWRPGVCAYAALLTAVLGCTRDPPARTALRAESPDPAAVVWFEDVTDKTGVSAVYRNGEEADRYAILESLGGGVAALDFDGDGQLDLFFPGGGGFDGPDKKRIKGHPPKLYRNLGGWRFADVTAAAGLDQLADGAEWFYTHGVAVGDYDRDGWADLLVTGYGRVALFRNEPGAAGGRRFREVTRAAGLLGPHFWASSAAWGDLDGDGWADLYVCQYVDWSNDNDPHCTGYYPGIPRDVCPPAKFSARPHALFRNRGDGTFEDVTAAAGLRTGRADKDHGKALGVLFVDVDLDGRADVYVANDTTDNFLYLNRGAPGRLRFDERGLELGVSRDGNGLPNGSMGVDAADFDGAGRPALWVTNYENEFHALYRNHDVSAGRLLFTFATPAAGLAAVGREFVGFGTAFADVDADGWEDLVVSNGHVMRHSPKGNISQRPLLFHNTARGGGRGFVDALGRGGGYFSGNHRGRGLSVADLDNDGLPDLVFTHINQPARLLRNTAPAAHWLGVELVGRDRRDVVGARASLRAGGTTRTRFWTAGRSYLSACDPRRLFGLGAVESAGRLTVHWPSGEPRVEHWDGLAIDRYHRIEQGKGRAG